MHTATRNNCHPTTQLRRHGFPTHSSSRASVVNRDTMYSCHAVCEWATHWLEIMARVYRGCPAGIYSCACSSLAVLWVCGCVGCWCVASKDAWENDATPTHPSHASWTNANRRLLAPATCALAVVTALSHSLHVRVSPTLIEPWYSSQAVLPGS